MMREEPRCCGTCRYHEYEDVDYVCTNEESDYYSDWTDYDVTCADWEGKDEGTA